MSGSLTGADGVPIIPRLHDHPTGTWNRNHDANMMAVDGDYARRWSTGAAAEMRPSPGFVVEPVGDAKMMS